MDNRKGASAEQLREALEDMCIQFAYSTSRDGKAALFTGGLSALEDAFDILGWEDPHPIPWDTCDEPGCDQRTSCGFPTPNGYRRTCGAHYKLARETAP